ncbi:MAG: hypothetical protein AB8B50_13695, partial [Pirellulaceae bacterium]
MNGTGITHRWTRALTIPAVVLLFTIGVTALGQDLAKRDAAIERERQVWLIEEAKQARDSNAVGLKTAYATGKVRHTIEDGGPITVLV